MFIRNFQSTYECPSTAETLKTIRQKHEESLRDFVKCFCNTRNVIPYIQDIEIINTFHDSVNDVKTVEEIIMKKTKMAADLLPVVDTSIEFSKARAQLHSTSGVSWQGAHKKEAGRPRSQHDRLR
jgi:hypothetical protein